MKTPQEDKAFAAGVVYACARLVEMYDQPGMAEEILKESGVDVNLADKYDRDFLSLPLTPRTKKG